MARIMIQQVRYIMFEKNVVLIWITGFVISVEHQSEDELFELIVAFSSDKLAIVKIDSKYYLKAKIPHKYCRVQ